MSGRRYRIRGGRPLRGAVTVPGDKSIGHRALIFAALASGPSTIEELSPGLDNRATADALRALGVPIALEGTTARVDGVGLHGLRMPDADLDCGNSGTTMRLMAGVLVAQKFGVRLVGDASLRRRPMARIVLPLRARGGHIAGRPGEGGEHHAPLSVAPLVDGEALVALEHASPVASAQVKSALLLSGLYATGATALAEPTLSRDHTERMMLALGVPLERRGPILVLDPDGWSRRWDGVRWTLPGDLSGAAFLLAAALVTPGSEVRVEGVGTNPTRTGLLEVLRAMRARVDIEARGERAGDEPVADLTVRTGRLGPGRVAGEWLTRMIDEVPAFAAVAAAARGTSEVRDAAELRVKESDRLAAIEAVLRAFGVRAEALPDGLRIHGGRRPRPAEVASRGDHRIAMMATVLALAADGESVVRDVACVDTSFPGFVDRLRGVGAAIEEEDDPGGAPGGGAA
ncbi:MAG: 3-phosphoshikimate 1-carboxyvinyltransferase [Sandaracinaceae bacterium]